MSNTPSRPPPPPPPPEPAATMSPAPKRGGIHPQLGRFIGGARLNDSYQMISGSGAGLYRFSTQRRHEKTIGFIEQTLRDARDSITGLKFNGTLEPGKDNPSEIGKERFTSLLKKRVIEHGQQTFYYIKDTDDKVVNLFEHSHRFKLEAVIAEHYRRAAEDNILYEAYDSIERDDFQLSRGVVESFFSESFLEKIEIRFNHLDDFDTLPGSCLFMMALETCNASVFHDVEGAKKKLEALNLSDYPGENVTDLSSEAQRLLKIMTGAYALPVNTGSSLLMKLTNTSSEIFNRKIFALLDTVMTLESEYELKDPRLFTNDRDYARYGPLGLVASIQASHGLLLSQQRWPALASSLPQSNNSTVSSDSAADYGGTVSLNGRKCFRCQGNHLVRDCPLPAPTGLANGSSSLKVKPSLAAWKYVKPVDVTVPRVDFNGKTWKFCSKCKCRATGKFGIYQLSHWESEHVDNYRHPRNNLGANPASSHDNVVAPPEVPLSVPTIAPEGNLSSVTDPNLIQSGPPTITVRFDDVESASHEMDEIRFTGMWCAPVYEPAEPPPCPNHLLSVHLNCTSVNSPASANATITGMLPYQLLLTWWETVTVDMVGNIETSAAVDKDASFRADDNDNVSGEDWLDDDSSHPWDVLLPAVWYDLEHSSFDDEFYDASKSASTYPPVWMTLTSYLLAGNDAFHGQSPFLPIHSSQVAVKYPLKQLSSAYQRIGRLEERVVFNHTTFVEYQLYKYQELWDMLQFRRLCNIISNPQQQHLKKKQQGMMAEEVGFKGQGFDPVRVHELCMKSVTIDCVTKPVSNKMTVDTKQNSIFGLTTAQEHLSSEAFTLLASDPQALMAVGGGQRKPVIFDTGASLGITYEKDDFEGPLTIPEGDLRLGGMAQGLKIEGVGAVTWTFRNFNSSEVCIRSQCYYVPEAKVRLISPQRLFDKHRGITGRYEGDEDTFTLHFDGGHRLVIEYDQRNHLPIGYATVGNSNPTISPQAHLLLLNDSNQNITVGHRLLLNWHNRFGHLNFPAVQRILRQFPFVAQKFAAAAKCDLTDLRCEICQYAKAHRRSTHGRTSHTNEECDGSLKAEHLGPGVRVSVDHFESRLLGRTRDSYGKPSSDKFKGGCIFVDHGSGYLHVEHQLGFSAVETIRAKQSFENMAFEHGVVIQSYLTDSGAFKANSFVHHIREHGQHIRYCGTNAHHQNGVAERSIRTVSNMARAMLLHSAAHWKNGVDSSLWPMAVTYAVYIYNNMPNAHNLCPADIFTGSTIPRHRLRDIHTWGCPVYVLDPSLQAGQKLPRWEPRSRRGVFVGLSTIHSSNVPLILNMKTGSITPQYHVVFDDRYSTVASIGRDEDPPFNWADLCLENTLYVPAETSPDSPMYLHDDWLTEPEREVKHRELQRQNRVRDLQHPQTSAPILPPTSSLSPSTSLSEGELTSIRTVPSNAIMPTSWRPAVMPPVTPSSPPVPGSGSTMVSSPPPVPPAPSLSPPLQPSDPLLAVSSSTGVRRSSRANKGTFHSTRYINETYLMFVESRAAMDSHTAHLAYLAEASTCCNTGFENTFDPRAYAAKTPGSDPDMPTFHQAMNGAHAAEYVEAMKLEIATLTGQQTWEIVPRTGRLNVLKSTWAFKLKRLPDGTPYRFKARFCARGDMQKEGVDYFDTYAPVVQWSTVRLLLSTVLTEGWATRQVDYTNAFAQAMLKEEVYIEFPKMFGPQSWR